MVRHWFARYRSRYGVTVRLETVTPHIDSPTRADVFVIATFRSPGANHVRSRPDPDRPKDGRYYRSVQLELRHGRWRIQSVRPT